MGALDSRARPLGRAGELASRVGLRACEPGGAGQQHDAETILDLRSSIPNGNSGCGLWTVN
jgi:hypothetical protein